MRRPNRRSKTQHATVKALSELHPEIETVVRLFEDFARILRHQLPEQLEQWMAEAGRSGIADMQGFVTKLRQDLQAVLAGIRLPWSQGQTEGQITKLKLIRRQMYGRGKFDLVRKRALRVA